MIVTHVTLVVDFDEHISVTLIEKPIGRAIGSADDRSGCFQPFILAEVKQAEDHDHSKFIRFVQNSCQPLHIFGPQRSILAKSRIMPRLLLGVAFRRAALEIDREREQTMSPPLRHRGNEFTRVPLRVPLGRIRISPALHRRRI